MTRNTARFSLLSLAILLGLGACSAPEPPSVPASAAPDASAPDAAPIAAPAAASDAAALEGHNLDALIEAANAALAADRMFAPPGDNALELLLRVLKARPDDARARQGLVDILPFVLIGLEQRLVAGDVAETERLLALFRRADSAHPALPRLAAQLDAERERQQLAEAARAEADARRAATAVAESAAAPTAEHRATAASVAPSAAAPTQQPAATPPLASANPPKPLSPEPAPPPAAVPEPAPVGLPPVLAQVPPRYPPQAQRRRIEGLVEVEFTVRADGSVADARVLRSEPEGVFDREALGAIQRWRFEATGREVVGRRVFDFRLGG